MGKSTRKRITRTTDRPARSASRSTTEPTPTASASVPAVEITAEPVAQAAPVIEAAPAVSAPSHGQVAQLAFRYFAESGYAHGHALDHWLRAESELVRA